jgi:hypothetical protein
VVKVNLKLIDDALGAGTATALDAYRASADAESRPDLIHLQRKVGGGVRLSASAMR